MRETAVSPELIADSTYEKMSNVPADSNHHHEMITLTRARMMATLPRMLSMFIALCKPPVVAVSIK